MLNCSKFVFRLLGNLDIRKYTGKYLISQLVENSLDKRYIQGGLSSKSTCSSVKKFRNDYKQTISTQYLVSQATTNSQK